MFILQFTSFMFEFEVLYNDQSSLHKSKVYKHSKFTTHAQEIFF
jgi:hypothetical protein